MIDNYLILLLQLPFISLIFLVVIYLIEYPIQTVNKVQMMIISMFQIFSKRKDYGEMKR